MDVKKFFTTYPGAKPLWKVGGKYFFNSREDLAKAEAARSGNPVVEVPAPEPDKPAPTPKNVT